MSRFASLRTSNIILKLAVLLAGLGLGTAATAQLPGDLPWSGSSCGGQQVIVQNGIGALTCGVTTGVPAADRYTFAMFNLDAVIPGSGRVNQTAQAEVYHHSSWHIDQIGNVYGVAFNTNDGSVYLTTSSNYGAGFFGQTAVLRYGSIAGGTSDGNNDSGAAGAVYRIDPVTGQATVFANLPQQSFTFTHQDCEVSSETKTRTNSGVGLGNIAYDPDHDQFFVSNIEDGRIYRLDASGNILDSYDPFAIDNGAAGVPNTAAGLEELVAGLAVEPGGGRLFFGGVDATTGSNSAGAGSPGIYSVNLTPGGGFSGSVSNLNMPVGATWDNYVGADVLHTTIPTGSGFTYADGDIVYVISDLAFNADADLIVGIRVSCNTRWFTSYNHWGETDIVTKNIGTGLYNNSITELDVSVTGLAGPDDSYGGVATYVDGSGNDIIATSSADILAEPGPHGIAVFDDPPNAGSISPLAAISYGTVDSGDPKGVGGEIEIWTTCATQPCFLMPTINTTCNNQGTTDPSDDTYTYTISIQSEPTSGTAYTISGDDAQAALAYDVVHGPFGPFLITGGDLSLTIIDDDNPICNVMETVTAPMECSDCTLSGPTILTTCDNQGTSDPNDDTFTFTISVSETGGDGLSYAISGDFSQSGLSYGVTEGPFGPFPITGGNLTITITDEGDGACQLVNQTVTAPAACSPLCNLTAFFSTTCDNQGTTDPSDDTYMYTILVPFTPASGPTYTVGGDDSQIKIDYGVINGPYGPFLITDGDLSLTITDDLDGTCNSMETVTAPMECSVCTLAGPMIVATCDDQGTSDPSDDTFTFTIEMNETGGDGVSYALSGDVTQGGLLYGATEGPFGPFPITGGDLTITITDEGDGACQLLNETVSAPATCSPACNLSPTIVATCDNQGTTNPNDDTYTYTIIVPSEPASGPAYSISGDDAQANLAYDVVHGPFGPFLITGGDLSITITDDTDGTCDLNTSVNAPLECSNCILDGPIVVTDCNHNNTSDPSDDTFTFTIVMNETGGDGVSYALTGDVTQSGLLYGAEYGPYGPFLITDGDLTITITDEGDGACQLVDQTITAPAACSPPCDLVPVILTSCNNQGTSNPADDTYSFTIFLPVGSGSVTSNGFNISGAETQNALAYGVTHGPFGNFLITGGDVSITLTDVDDPTCSVMKMITAPADCSVPCSLNPMIMAICDDNGTLDPNDDTYTYTITVLSGMSTGTSYSITGDDAQSNLPYDVTNGPFGPFPINGGDIDITITDDDDPFCNTAETVTAPGACSPLPASIGNYVWEDVNANGIQDDGPTGIGGVKVTLTGTDQYGNPVMDMQFTAPDGSYLFDNLIPGDYKLTFETPAGYTTTDVNQGGNDAADSDANPAMGGMTVVETLTSGENNTDYDAGYYLPAELGNYTWIDDDVDGQQDGGEQPLGGVTVVLSGTTGSGEPVNQTAITDANGLYLFDNLQPGTYKVTFQSPVGIYNSTQVDQGPDASDSDADPAMGGMTGNYTLESGDSDLTVDAGYYADASIGNFVWEDLDGDGIQDPGEPGLQGVEVTLTGTDNFGNPVSQTKFTDIDGSYIFDELVPGDYKLTFGAYGGFTLTVNGQGPDASDSNADPSMGGMTVVETLTSGENNTDYDAGYYQPAELGNYTWIDAN
ncbi:MAG: carboxypeptidase regulatory-like domain-containing protein, partial [Saprospiraceae bacterium]|nr:carboxypeptidase regulatory-like domain-containing protein [Saprospiraceae bacterium]